MNYKKTTFPNDLRIITAPMKDTQTATVVIMVGVGSRYEGEKEAGISHFIEHMFFKGTEKRPTALAISEEIDSVGGEFNAFTSKDATGYYVKVDAKHLELAIDVVSDMYLNSKIEQEEIDREKGTILQELNMYQDTPMRSVGDVFEGLLYGKNPLGRDIIGYKKTISSFKRKDFMDYISRFYLANDTVVAVAGKINEKEVIGKIEKHFLTMRKNGKPKIKKVDDTQKSPQVKIKFKKTDQTHLVLGTRAYKIGHRDRFVISLLSVILGGGMSSRLFIEVRERRGLAYYVRSGVEAFDDAGYFAVSAGVEHKNLKLATETILGEMSKITREKVTEKELKKAKEYIKGKAVMGMEASDEVAMFFVEQEVSKKKIMTISEIMRRIEKVTSGDIMRVAKDIFQKNKLNLAVIGPHKNEKDLQKILTL
jgi:predicted Zn-dependent peptidase